MCRLASDAGQAWTLARAAIDALPDRETEVPAWPQAPTPTECGELPWEPAN